MTSKKKEDGRVMISRRIGVNLWERFRHFCEYHVPRTTDTAMLELALWEFLERRQHKTEKK